MWRDKIIYSKYEIIYKKNQIQIGALDLIFLNFYSYYNWKIIIFKAYDILLNFLKYF
jgi:hypothetical protein